MLDEIGNTICNLELMIDWIEKHTENQIPGWLNVTYAIREAIELIKKMDGVLTDLRATNIRYSVEKDEDEKDFNRSIVVHDGDCAFVLQTGRCGKAQLETSS